MKLIFMALSILLFYGTSALIEDYPKGVVPNEDKVKNTFGNYHHRWYTTRAPAPPPPAPTAPPPAPTPERIIYYEDSTRCRRHCSRCSEERTPPPPIPTAPAPVPTPERIYYYENNRCRRRHCSQCSQESQEREEAENCWNPSEPLRGPPVFYN